MMVLSRSRTWIVAAIALSAISSCKPKSTALPEAEAESESEERLTAGTCGSERWNVKTGQDPQAGSVSLTPTPTTIASLVGVPAPASPPANGRVAPQETTVWELVNVNVTFSKNEADSDKHIVVSDGSRTMVVEIPDPACVGNSPWKALISNARQTFTGQTGTATVKGVGFFDRIHGQTGIAPNGFELHPVLGICFGQNCSLGSYSGDGGSALGQRR
jgi:hypothetical protein